MEAHWPSFGQVLGFQDQCFRRGPNKSKKNITNVLFNQLLSVFFRVNFIEISTIISYHTILVEDGC